jgi:putative aldouronate transport system substrate-binding protein
MLVAFKTKDPDGVGVNNIIAYGAYGGFGSSYFALANGFGLHLDQSGGWAADAGGKVQFEFLLPAFRDYLAFMNKLYAEKLIDQQLFQPTLAALESLITLNYIGGATVGSNPILKWDNIQQGAGHKTVDWDSITPPVKNASDRVFVEKRGGVLTGRRFAISRDCKIPESALRWMDFVYASPQGVMMANYGIEGEHYTMVNGKPKFTDYIMKHPKGWAPLPATRSTGAQVDVVQFTHINGYLDQLGSEKQINHVRKFDGMFIDKFPSLISTSEESRTVSSTMPEINTYRDEMIEKFVTGKESLGNFDRYVSTIRGMGIDRAIAVYQAQYDRYVKAMK